MKNRNLHRSALSIAMGLCLAALTPVAMAQDGAVVGVSEAGAQVTVRNPQTGFSRTVTADASGNYRFSYLPVGTYELQASANGEPVGEPVQVRVGDGSRGWEEHAPYDAVLVTAAAAAPPFELLEQLRPGGRMVLPIGVGDVQKLSLVEKRADALAEVREVMPVRFTQLELS